jgi:hypothetical protein
MKRQDPSTCVTKDCKKRELKYFGTVRVQLHVMLNLVGSMDIDVNVHFYTSYEQRYPA